MSEREVLFSDRDEVFRPVIYGLVDPSLPQIVRYVGKAHYPACRYAQHLAVTNRDRSQCARWKRSLRRRGHCPVMVVLEWTTKRTLDAAELRWIEDLKRIGRADLNGPSLAAIRRNTLAVRRSWRERRKVTV